jgi:hypothetical protein
MKAIMWESGTQYILINHKFTEERFINSWTVEATVITFITQLFATSNKIQPLRCF